MSEIIGLESLSLQALRDRHAGLVAQINELSAHETVSLADARAINAATVEANKIVPLIVEFVAAPEALAELPAPAVIVPPVVVTETPAVAITNFVEGEEQELAEAIAAAAALRPSVSIRHEAEVVPVAARPALTASAASTSPTATAGKPLSLSDIGEIVQRMAYDKGINGHSQPIVTFAAPEAISASAVRADNHASANTRILNDMILAEQEPAREGLTAAPFTVCGPPDILREVPECLNTDRYVNSWFRGVQSTHGQIQFYKAFGLADVISGVNTWDQAKQTAIDPADSSTWKQCVQIGCLPTATIGVEAITQCMCMPVFQTMTSPEAVASALYAIRAATARTADAQLLGFFDVLASKYTFDAGSSGNPYGATIDIYDMLGRFLGMFAAQNRNIDLSGYTLGLEVGMLEHLALDNQMACNPRLATEAANALFGGLGIGNIQVTPDWSAAIGAGPYTAAGLNAPGAAAAALPARPSTWQIRLFNGSDFAYLTPQGETFGIIPDYNNKLQNKVCWFGEIFQGLGKLGCNPAVSVQVTNLKATGARAACVTYP